MNYSDIIYINEAAPLFGKTETALRAMLQRAEKTGKKEGIPPFFRIGNKFAFSRAAIKAWIKKGGAA